MSVVGSLHTFAAAIESFDALAGTEFEFSPPQGATYNVAFTWQTAGATIVTMDVFFGSVQKANGISGRETVGINETPTVPDDLKLSERAPGGVKIRVIFNNSAAVASTVQPLIEIK